MCDYSLYYKTGNTPCENGYSFNVSSLPEAYAVLQVSCACVCNSEYTAASDYFDMRLLAVNSSFVLSESCEMRVISITIVWSILLVACLFGFVGNAVCYFYYRRKYNTQLMPSFGLGLFVHLLGVFMVMITCILKIQANEQYVLGTNTSLTIVFFLALVFSTGGYHVPFYFLEEFFVNATIREYANPLKAKASLRMKQRFIFVSHLMFICMYIPIFIMLVTPKNGTRNDSTLIKLRSAFLVLGINYCGYVLFETFLNVRTSNKLVKDLQAIKVHQAPAVDSLLQLAILSRNDTMRVFVPVCAVCVMYAIFFLPFLYPMQVYMFLVTAVLSSDVKAIHAMFFITKTMKELNDIREFRKQSSNDHMMVAAMSTRGASSDGKSIAQVKLVKQLYEKYRQEKNKVPQNSEEVKHNNSVESWGI